MISFEIMSVLLVKIMLNTVLFVTILWFVSKIKERKAKKLKEMGELKDDIILMKNRSHHEKAMQRARERAASV